MISLIVAMDRNRNIGLDGDMPWGKTMRADLKRFRELTSGKSVVMGRKTYESIGQPLPYRSNVILSRSPELASNVRIKKNLELDAAYKDTMVLPNIEEFFQLAKLSKIEEHFIIGGAQIYEQFMPYADKIYVTKVANYFEGDTKFPEIAPGKWKITQSSLHPRDEFNPYPYQYITYERAI
jgi:dihydrofolate reductase